MRIPIVIMSLCIMFLEIGCGNAASEVSESPYIPVKGSAWHLALADVTGDGENELIYAAYDGTVRCQDIQNGNLLWETPIGGFPFNIASADVDHDGHPEIFVACADGGLYALRADGTINWIMRTDRALFDVGIGDVISGGNLEIICTGLDQYIYVVGIDGSILDRSALMSRVVNRLTCSDIDLDGADEIVAIDSRTFLDVWEYEGESFRRKWREKVSGGILNLDIGDLDSDGVPEIVSGGGSKKILTHTAEGKSIWGVNLFHRDQPPQLGLQPMPEAYCTPFIKIVEVDAASPGREVFVIQGGEGILLDQHGNILRRGSAPIGFTSLLMDGTTAWLGSSPNGDDTVYRLDLSGDWVATLNNMDRQGHAEAIGANLSKLREQVMAYEGKPHDDRGPFLVMRGGDVAAGRGTIAPEKTKVDAFEAEHQWYRSQFPYANLSFAVTVNVIEPEPTLDITGKPWNPKDWKRGYQTSTPDELVEFCRYIEEKNFPVIFTMGHGCIPWISLDTAERMLQAAPTALIGFLVAEDENLDVIPKYYKHFLGPLADLCIRYGYKKIFMKNKGTWWMDAPPMEVVYETLFTGERRKVFVPSSEDSNSRTPEINALGRSGVWLSGLVDYWHVGIHLDLFTFNRFFQWEYPKHGHPHLRRLIAHTLLGANTYRIQRAYGTTHNIDELRPLGDTFAFTREGREITEILFHMIGKGILLPPERAEVIGMSRIGFAVHVPPDKWHRDAHNGHLPERWIDDPEMDNAVFPHIGVTWGMTPTPAHAIQRVLLEKDRQFGDHVPATPYGPFVIVPAQADLDNVPFVEEWWHTDGIYAWKEDGLKLTGMEAAKAIEADFERAAAKLPFRADGGVFFQTVKMDNSNYRLYAVDSGWLDPQDRDVTLSVQLPGDWRLKDTLSGEEIPIDNGTAQFTCPAGAFRILDATVQ
jgi:lambda-carrageenase